MVSEDGLFPTPLILHLGKYLDIPLVHKRVKGDTFKHIVDKVGRRLSSWKSRFVSKADKALLIHTTTAIIPFYIMQIAKLPSATIDELERVNRNFLWGHDEDNKRKLHTFSLENYMQP